MKNDIKISGFTKPGFEDVREAFVANFEDRGELGAACCIYHQGEVAVDLWGGIRNEETNEPWERDTMVVVFSTTKGIAALTMAHAHSMGLFSYDAPVSTYWPEFAQHGKEHITIRQLMGHQAGLYTFEGQGNKEIVADLDRLGMILARQKPAWVPGSRQGYHAITLGYYENELLRRVDPEHRSIGMYFQEKIATPLGLDFYIGLPEEIPNSRLAVIKPANYADAWGKVPARVVLAAMNPRSILRKGLEGSLLPLDEARVYARNLEIPAGGGVGTARAIARVYGAFATGGKELGLQPETLDQLMAPPVAPRHGFRDEAYKLDVAYSLGFMKPLPNHPFGPPSSFGAPGSGGSFGFADPDAKIGYGYVTNRMKPYLEDPRDLALREAMYRAIGKGRGVTSGTPGSKQPGHRKQRHPPQHYQHNGLPQHTRQHTPHNDRGEWREAR